MWCVMATGPSRVQIIGPFSTAQDAANFVANKFTAPAWANSMVACPMEDPEKYKSPDDLYSRDPKQYELPNDVTPPNDNYEFDQW